MSWKILTDERLLVDFAIRLSFLRLLPITIHFLELFNRKDNGKNYKCFHIQCLSVNIVFFCLCLESEKLNQSEC